MIRQPQHCCPWLSCGWHLSCRVCRRPFSAFFFCRGFTREWLANPRLPTSTGMHLVLQPFLHSLGRIPLSLLCLLRSLLPGNCQLLQDQLLFRLRDQDDVRSQFELGSVCWNFRLLRQVNCHWLVLHHRQQTSRAVLWYSRWLLSFLHELEGRGCSLGVLTGLYLLGDCFSDEFKEIIRSPSILYLGAAA